MSALPTRQQPDAWRLIGVRVHSGLIGLEQGEVGADFPNLGTLSLGPSASTFLMATEPWRELAQLSRNCPTLTLSASISLSFIYCYIPSSQPLLYRNASLV